MAVKVRRNDKVKVLSGKDKGKTGKVLRVDRKKMRVIIEGINIVKKAKRPDQQNQKGGIVELESPIYISNIMIVCPKCGNAIRIKKKVLGDGKKVRICGKCGEVLDKV